jgi:hypothetical protein
MTNTRVANRAGRKLVLVDIENLVASPSPTTEQVGEAVDNLSGVISGFDHALRYVACSHRAARVVAFAVPFGRCLWQSGPNGADLALLDILDNGVVDERFECVTVCSGDGIFAEAVSRLAGKGVDVTVVALQGHLSRRLNLAARRVVYVPPVTPAAPAGNAS